jgi:hypothetical protein
MPLLPSWIPAGRFSTNRVFYDKILPYSPFFYNQPAFACPQPGLLHKKTPLRGFFMKHILSGMVF